MAFSEALAERTRQALGRRKNVEEKKMYRDIGFLLNGNLFGSVRTQACMATMRAPRSMKSICKARMPKSRFRSTAGVGARGWNSRIGVRPWSQRAVAGSESYRGLRAVDCNRSSLS